MSGFSSIIDGFAPAQLDGLLASLSSWHHHAASVTHLLDDKLPADAMTLILQHLDGRSLLALMQTCCTFRLAASEMSTSFNEHTFCKLCNGHGWTHESLADVALHVSKGRFTQCPPWLYRLTDRLRNPALHHMHSGVVAKISDAMGQLNPSRERFMSLRPSYRRLYFACIKHHVRPGQPLISTIDVAEVRKLRGLQAYMYAEGWTESRDEPHYLDHTIEHVLAGRIDLA